MKAIRCKEWGGPELLAVEEVDLPPPGQGEVRIRVHAAGVN
ncbi:MAG: quinone oxidoreductase, partial [Betaproteobacteria bacterium]|nr:quinone oxidoreductase [Betaproteobacteria bacterium]